VLGINTNILEQSIMKKSEPNLIGLAQRLQIKPGCLQVPQKYTEAPTPTPTIIFSSLEEVSEAEAD